MKSSKSKAMSKRMRRLAAAQVQEYVDYYYPQWGKVSVKVSPCGTFASVVSTSEPAATDEPEGDDETKRRSR